MGFNIAFYRIVATKNGNQISSDHKLKSLVGEITIFQSIKKMFLDEWVVKRQEQQEIKKSEEKYIKYKYENVELFGESSLFGKLFYGNLLEREKVVIKDGEEIELKPGDWDQEEYYFLLKEHNHPHFGKSIFLVLQSGIKSAIIDSVYKRKLKALEDKVRETSTESINFNIKIYNFMNVVQKYGQKQLKKIEIFYNQNSNFSTKAKIEEKLNNVFLEYKLEVSKFSHKFKSIFDIFNEIDFEDVSEINYEIETRKGSKQKLKWSKEENLLNLQARADITDKIEKTDKNFESIYTIFEETFKEVVGE